MENREANIQRQDADTDRWVNNVFIQRPAERADSTCYRHARRVMRRPVSVRAMRVVTPLELFVGVRKYNEYRHKQLVD